MFLLGFAGAYCALWPITDEAKRWGFLLIIVLLTGALWIVEGMHDRRTAADQALRDQQQAASGREIQRHLRDQLPAEGTLKQRAIGTALRVNDFLRNRASQEPDWLNLMHGVTGDALRDIYFRVGDFHAETLALYQQRFGRRTAALLEELFAHGVVTRVEVESARACGSDFELHDRVVQLLYRSGQRLPD